MSTVGRVVLKFLVVVLVVGVSKAIEEDDEVFGLCGGGYSDASEIPNSYSSGKSSSQMSDHAVDAESMQVMKKGRIPYKSPVPRLFKSGATNLEDRANRTFKIKIWPTKMFHDSISNNETIKAQFEMVWESVTKFFQNFLGVEKHARSGQHDVTACIREPNDITSVVQETGTTNINDVEKYDYHLVLNTGLRGSCNDNKKGVLAYATPCGSLKHSNKNGRDLIGLTYICPGTMSGKHMQNIAIESTLKHEIFHALGVNSGNLKDSRFSKTIKKPWRSSKGETMRDRTFYSRNKVRPELMTGIISRRSYLSIVTVTFMQLLGSETKSVWYPWVNTNMTEDLWYGKGATCLFTDGSCMEYIEKELQKSKRPRTPSFPFCSMGNIQAYKEAKKSNAKGMVDLGTCSPDHKTVLKCLLNDNPPKGDNEAYSFYYPGENIRGNSEMAEYCPTFIDTADGFKDTNCYNSYSQPEGSKNFGAERFGGTDSGCFEQQTPFYMTNCKESTWKRMLFGGGKSISGFSGAGCYKFLCLKGRMLVKAAGDDSRYGAKVCWAEGSTVIVRRMIDDHTFVYGEILCPKCTAYCSQCLPEIKGLTPRDQLEPACQGELRLNEASKCSILFSLIVAFMLAA